MPITPWIQFSTKEHPLRMKKEIVTIGTWHKGDQTYDISMEFSRHLKKSHEDMLAEGIKTPLILSHKGESAYADLISLEIEKNERGEDALFGIFDFKDQASYDEAKRNDVSIYVPPKRLAGNGKEYLRVLEHVALTPWPVVPGLKDWEAIAASMQSIQLAQENKTVEPDELISVLEIEVPEGASEETTWALILNAVKALKKEVDGDGDSSEGEEKPAGDSAPPAIAASFNPPKSLVGTVKGARITKLDSLVSSECITPAVRDQLAKEYATDEVVSLSLKDEKSDDGFDRMVATLEKNKVTPRRGAFESDFIALSHDGGNNPEGRGQKLTGLKADAKRRQEEADKKSKRR